MLWGWLKPFLDWLEGFLRRQASQPRTIDDAKTPPDIRRRWADYIRDKLRDKGGGN
jgi:hypothetical protein